MIIEFILFENLHFHPSFNTSTVIRFEKIIFLELFSIFSDQLSSSSMHSLCISRKNEINYFTKQTLYFAFIHSLIETLQVLNMQIF